MVWCEGGEEVVEGLAEWAVGGGACRYTTVQSGQHPEAVSHAGFLLGSPHSLVIFRLSCSISLFVYILLFPLCIKYIEISGNVFFNVGIVRT